MFWQRADPGRVPSVDKSVGAEWSRGAPRPVDLEGLPPNASTVRSRIVTTATALARSTASLWVANY